jgi:hypothetical protein
MNVTAVCDVVPCSVVERSQHFGGTRCLHLRINIIP